MICLQIIFSLSGKDFEFLAISQKPCKAAQWGDGVLAANVTFQLDPMSPIATFVDWPLGVVRDGLGGAFVLIGSQTYFGAAQSPIAMAFF